MQEIFTHVLKAIVGLIGSGVGTGGADMLDGAVISAVWGTGESSTKVDAVA